MNRLTVALLCGICAASAFANPIPMPEPRQVGSPIPSREIPDFQIEMLSEDVTLTLLAAPRDASAGRGQPYEDATARLQVSGNYKFKNYGARTSLDICFPCHDKLESESIKISMDGKEGIKARPLADADGNAETPWGGWPYDSWMMWTAEFPEKSECSMMVQYTVVVKNIYEAGYVVASGAPWKGNIGNATFTLKFGEGFAPDCVRELKPRAAMTFKDGCYRWEMKDFEPDTASNIWIRYALEPWKDKIARLQQKAKDWSGKYRLAEHLASPPPGHENLAELNTDERQAFLTALEGLVPRSKESGDKLIVYEDAPVRLPGPDGEDEGDQVRYMDEVSLTGTMENSVLLSIRAVKEMPEEKRAVAVLEAFVKIMARSAEDKLFLDQEDEEHSIGSLFTDSLLDEAKAALKKANK